MNSKFELLKAIPLAIALSLQAASALPSYTLLLSYHDGPLPNGGIAGNLLGGPAGTPSDEIFFELPTIGNGLVDGVWRYQNGLFNEIANSSQSIAGLPLWRQQSNPQYFLFEDVAPTGQFAILDTVFLSGVTQFSLYYGSGPSFSLVARAGGSAASITGGTIKTLPGRLPALSSTGQGVYTALVTVPDGAQTKDIGAVWRIVGNKLVAKDGDIAPGTANASFGDLFTNSSAVADGAGGILLLAALTNGVGDAMGSNNEGLWLSDENGANLQLVLRQGAAAPGLAGATIQTFHYAGSSLLRHGVPQITAGGKIAFVAQINGAPSGLAVYFGVPGNLVPILKPVDPAPTLPGEKISTIASYYVNDSDQVLILARLAPSVAVNNLNDEVAFLWNAGAWTLVAREGQPVPDAPGLVIGSLTSPSTSQLTAFGPLAQGALFIPVRGSGSAEEFSNARAILHFTNGGISTVAYEGQTITLRGQPLLLTLLTHTERSLAGMGHVAFRAFLGGSTVGSGTQNQEKLLVASFGAPFPTPLPFSSPTPSPGGEQTPSNTPPSITVAPKFSGKNGKAKLKGTVSSGVVKVEIKVGKGKFKPAKLAGTSWSLAAKNLKDGKNAVTIVATNANGVSTKTKTKIVAN